MRSALVLLAVGAILAACAPRPADLGLDEAVLENDIGRRIGSPGTCVVLASDGEIVYRWGTHVICGRELPSCEGSATTTAEALAVAGAPRRVSCPNGTDVAAWWSGSGRTSKGVVTFAASMAGPDALPAIEVERRLTPVFKNAGLTVGVAPPP